MAKNEAQKPLSESCNFRFLHIRMTRSDIICNTIGAIIGIVLWIAYRATFGDLFVPP